MRCIDEKRGPGDRKTPRGGAGRGSSGGTTTSRGGSADGRCGASTKSAAPVTEKRRGGAPEGERPSVNGARRPKGVKMEGSVFRRSAPLGTGGEGKTGEPGARSKN